MLRKEGYIDIFGQGNDRRARTYLVIGHVLFDDHLDFGLCNACVICVT